MKNAVILHGTGGNSKENWFQWLKKELLSKGYEKVWVPNLPGADRPNVCTYNAYLDERYNFNKDTMMVGHSSGAVSILGLLNKLPEDKKIKKAVLVAGFKDNLDWEDLSDLFIYKFDWKKLQRMCDEYILIHSTNDPYVPMKHGELLKDKLGPKAKLIVMKDQKHFSMGSYGPKYKKFPELLKYL